MPNQLIHETSPYLLQHAYNPVDWYPWSEAAFAKAKKENKPIFLSIGYSACHWCHVMEHESFENETIAEIMNKHYVNIKVDREERPDIDAIYMEAVIAMTQQGGWPMSVWLTSEGVPFYGGTYFPPTDRMNMPGFGRLSERLAEIYHQQQDKIQQQGEALLDHMKRSLPLKNETPLDPANLDLALQNLKRLIDYQYGGTQGAPKFPQPMMYDFLLRAYHRSQQNGNQQDTWLEIVELTLQKMAQGGIYDHLGGGFHRYSTDALWLVPHFEKMLYDNALLARLYLHTYQLTNNPEYKYIVEATLDYVVREMTDPLGGFYSTQDADSEGEEGKFFVWTPEEIKSILGDIAGEHFCAAYDVTPGGNWEGHSILWLKTPLAETARQLKMPLETLKAELAVGRQKLFIQREKRIKPARDEKILTAWNGLMLAAFAEAARVLEREDYLAVALKNAEFVLTHLQKEGRLLRTWKEGQAKLMGYLEDYAFLADGLLALYQTTFDDHWFVAAKDLMETILTHFSDTENGGFFDTADDHEQLIVRPKSWQDNAIPSGNSMAIRTLLQLATYTGDTRYYDPAIRALSGLQAVMSQYAGGMAHWLGTMAYATASVQEIALVGQADNEGMQAILQVLQKPYRPHQVVGLTPEPTTTSPIPLLNNRPQKEGQDTVYVCQNFACQLPVTTVEALKAQL